LAENLLPQRPWCIFPLHEAACLQHRDHPIDKEIFATQVMAYFPEPA
jgi:hypothetical protein